MALINKDTQAGTDFTGKLKTVTQERMNKFSGGFPKGPNWPQKNIHTDDEFAMNCGLPGRVASGPMWEGYLVEQMINLFGESWLTEGKMNLKFITFVRPGDTLLPKAVVKSCFTEKSGTRLEMEVWCENQHSNKVVTGTATGVLR